MFGTRFVPDKSIKPPEIVQELVEKEDPDVSCGHCRERGATLRCGRCKCVKYLSRTCQQDHFALHKKNCKAIAKQREIVRDLLARCADPGSNYNTVCEMIKMGDLLVWTGYQESDTTLNGQLYYQEALKYYLMPMIIYKNSYHHALAPSVEDKVLLLIVALGGDDKAVRSWCKESEISGENPNPHEPNRILVDKSPRSDHYDTTAGEDEGLTEIMEQLGVKYRGLAKDDILFQVIYLFTQMKALSEFRQDIKRLEILKEKLHVDDDVSDSLLPCLSGHNSKGGEESIVGEIQSTIGAIQHFDKESYLFHLRDTLPLSEQHAPDLFSRGGHVLGSSMGREYLWMVLQDLFFETPGVNSILSEFVTGEFQSSDDDSYLGVD